MPALSLVAAILDAVIKLLPGVVAALESVHKSIQPAIPAAPVVPTVSAAPSDPQA